MNYMKKQAEHEAHHGMELLTDYGEWIKEVGVAAVTEATGKHLKEIEKYRRALKQLAHQNIQSAAREARLSLTVVIDLSNAVYPLRGSDPCLVDT